MGVLNVTPDSFFDGGRYLDPRQAIERGIALAEQGADIIDIGGESTRPGAVAVPIDQEMSRVIPVIEALGRSLDIPLSIDTRHAAVAEAALDAGALMVNDVSGFSADPDMVSMLGRKRPLAVAMHMRGTPDDMQDRTGYRSLLADCVTELWSSASRAVDAGLPLNNLLLDPGIGFAKDWLQSLMLLDRLEVFAALGCPLVVGVSRKSFIGRVLDRPSPERRTFGTAAAVAVAVVKGARILRVHDVAEMKDVIAVAHAIVSTRDDPSCDEVHG
jgi:dihydropteroate synthase